MWCWKPIMETTLLNLDRYCYRFTVKSSLAALHQILPEEIGSIIIAQYLKMSVNRLYRNIECSLDVFVKFLLWMISENELLDEVCMI